MASTSEETAGYLRYFHEILFSFNVALLFMQAKSATTRFPLLQWVKYRLFAREGYSDDYAAGYPAFLLLATALAVCLFLLLRLLARTSLAEKTLRFVAIVPALATVTVSWFYSGLRTWFLTGYVSSDTSHAWHYLEVAASIFCAFMYLYGKWPFPAWVTFPLLTVHYVLWAWIVWRLSFSNPWMLMFPALGFCSSLVWGFYISRCYPTRSGALR